MTVLSRGQPNVTVLCATNISIIPGTRCMLGRSGMIYDIYGTAVPLVKLNPKALLIAP